MGKRKPKPPAPPSRSRSIYFYRVSVGKDHDGRPIPLNVDEVLKEIAALQFTDTGRYMHAEEGNRLCCWFDDGAPAHTLKFGTVRRNAFPQVDTNGELTELGLPVDAGLCESIHCKFFSGSLIGSEFNFYGPRITRLGSYLAEKSPRYAGRVMFEPLLRKDVADQLARLKDVRLFKLKIQRSFAEKLRQVDESLGNAFVAASAVSDADEIEITLSPERYTRKGIGKRMLDAAKSLFGLEGFRDATERCQIKGLDSSTHRVEAVDLLSDKLIVKKHIMRQGERSRAVDSFSAYSAIEAAYEEVKDAAEMPVGVVVRQPPAQVAVKCHGVEQRLQAVV